MAAPKDTLERRDEDRRGESSRSSSERVYRALLRAYPEELRREYGEGMARTFRDLRRRELESRGVWGLVLLWSRTLLELASTVLTERGAMLTRSFSRNAYLPAKSMLVKKWGGLSALICGIIGTLAYDVGLEIPLQLSSVVVLLSVLSCNLALFGLYAMLAERSERSNYPGLLAAAGVVFAVVSFVSWLVLGAFTALGSVWEWAAVP